MSEAQAAQITADLQPLFDKARREGLWFFSPYADSWFSPDALEKEQANGRFRWGAVNWQLRDPREEVAALRRRAARLLKDAEEMERRIG